MQHARHAHVVRTQRAVLGDALDLRDDDAAIVAGGDGLLESTEIGALVFIGQVAPFIRRGGAQDADIGRDVREMKPGLAAELDPVDDRRRGTAGVHRAPFAHRIGKRLHADLGQHAGPAGGGLAVHVEHDARGHVVGGNPVLDDHPPDLRHRQIGRSRRIRPRQHAVQEPVLRDPVHAPDAIHVARGNGVQRRDVAGMTFGAETLPQCLQHQIGTAECRRGRDGDHRPVGDAGHGSGGRDKLCHAIPPTVWRCPVRAASRTARATASEAMPSSPVAAGRLRPATAAAKSCTACR